MRVYLDNEFKCHSDNSNGGYRDVEVAYFNGKCKTFVEGHRYIPLGEIFIDSTGAINEGSIIDAWKPYPELAAAQLQYELMMAEAEAAYREGVDSV